MTNTANELTTEQMLTQQRDAARKRLGSAHDELAEIVARQPASLSAAHLERISRDVARAQTEADLAGWALELDVRFAITQALAIITGNGLNHCDETRKSTAKRFISRWAPAAFGGEYSASAINVESALDVLRDLL